MSLYILLVDSISTTTKTRVAYNYDLKGEQVEITHSLAATEQQIGCLLFYHTP